MKTEKYLVNIFWIDLLKKLNFLKNALSYGTRVPYLFCFGFAFLSSCILLLPLSFHMSCVSCSECWQLIILFSIPYYSRLWTICSCAAYHLPVTRMPVSQAGITHMYQQAWRSSFLRRCKCTVSSFKWQSHKIIFLWKDFEFI
jgi:hypothetical protein